MPPGKTAPSTPAAPAFNQAGAQQAVSGLYSSALNSALQNAPALTAQNIASQGQAATSNAGLNYGMQQQYSPGYSALAVQNLNTLDPAEVALRSQLEGSASQQLGLGTSLDPAYAAQLQQSIRGAQAARGNSLGDAAGNAEALSLGSAGLAMQQERQQFAGNVAGQGGIGALTGEIPGIQNFGSNSMNAPGFAPITPELGFQGAGLGTSLAGPQASEYNAGLGYGAQTYGTATNAPNPWMQGLGLALGAGSALGAGALTGGFAPTAGLASNVAFRGTNPQNTQFSLQNGYNSP